MLKKQTQSIMRQNVSKSRIAIVQSTYHGDLTGSMEQAAREALRQAGVLDANIVTLTTPGSWEIPIVARAAAQSGQYDAIIAFGIIVKGETYHFEMIADNVGRALMDITMTYAIPVGFEVLAVYDIEHARIRASGEHSKGREAARAVLETIQTLNKAGV